jgi:beta-phosphoglucomutase-like phosphatase (HAD superfamily)
MTQQATPSRPGLSQESLKGARTAFLFDLDGTLVDSVYQHVLAWQEAMAVVGIDLAVWSLSGVLAEKGTVPRFGKKPHGAGVTSTDEK